MAVNFPSNPTNGQTITASGITYAYDSTQGVWSDSPQGLTQAIDALTDVDTSTSAPTNGQTLQWNSTDSEWQPADSSAGVTVYATIDDLPLSGVVEGSMALVDSTDKLYIFSDAGWYSISIVNTTPSISGVSATYTLSTNGTATTVTITATDPEGIPITYSIVSDTSGNIATVSQGTGSNTNVFTITPSTNSANAGTFSLTFRASDGVNIATAVSSFTLVFSIQNSNYTTALITSVGANNAVNNSFDDASTNNHTITANGNVTQGTFSPYRHGGYSTYFDGNDRLSLPQTSLNLGSNDFCVEAWVYTTATSQQAIAGSLVFSNGTGSWLLTVNYNNNKIRFFMRYGGGSIQDAQFEAGTFPTNQWVHVAVTRDGANLRAFINGTQAGTTNTVLGSNAIDNALTNYFIGDNLDGNTYWNGYITDFRVVGGDAVYTSAFTPPDERLSAITGTKLLACHLPYIADGSTNSHAITVNGNTKTEPFSPYDRNAYTASDNGGSMYFDGSGDRLDVPDTGALDQTAFTIGVWFRATGSNVIGLFDSAPSTVGTFRNYSSNVIQDQGNGGVTFSHTPNTWNWLCVVKNGTSFEVFVNDVSQGTASCASTLAETSLDIGQINAGGDGNFVGYMSDFVIKTTASQITVPASPLSSDANTALLLPFTDAGIIDKSQSVKTITLNGDVKSSTTQSKFLASSMYFDGTGDYITMTPSDLFAFRTGDFTIEGWAYITATGDKGLFQQGISNFPATNTNSVALQFTNAGPANSEWAIYAGDAYHESTVNYALNQWYHFAVVRASSVTKLYINGTEALSVSDSVDYTGTYFGVGSIYGAANAQCFTGYMSDFRVTKGLARYTSNFTVPSAALEG
jgi:hypothetical protein